MAIEQVKRLSISEQAYEQLRRQIGQGEWKPGDRLPSENELAAALGVSRITVRQALQKLATQGLVETKLGEGTFVRVFTPGSLMHGMLPAFFLGGSTLLEVLEFRGLIEAPIAELAAQKAQDADIRTLETIYDRMLKSRDTGKVFFHADLDFHLELASITGNSLAIETYTILKDLLEIAMERIVSIRGDMQGVYYHQLLLEAMRRRDAKACRSIMENHINDTYQSIEAFMKTETDDA